MHKLSPQLDRYNCCPSRRHGRRRGSLMLEVLVGTVLLGAFFVGALPVIAWVRTAQQLSVEQRIASLELANQMERVAAVTAVQRTEERLSQLKLSAEAAAVLDDAELSALVRSSEAFPGLQQIQLSLVWTNDSNQQVKPARLTAWFRPAAKQPETP